MSQVSYIYIYLWILRSITIHWSIYWQLHECWKGRNDGRRKRLVRIRLNALKLCLWFFALLSAVYRGFRVLSVPTRKLFYRDARCIVCTKQRRMFYRLAFVLTARKVTYTFSVDLRIFKKLVDLISDFKTKP